MWYFRLLGYCALVTWFMVTSLLVTRLLVTRLLFTRFLLMGNHGDSIGSWLLSCQVTWLMIGYWLLYLSESTWLSKWLSHTPYRYPHTLSSPGYHIQLKGNHITEPPGPSRHITLVLSLLNQINWNNYRSLKIFYPSNLHDLTNFLNEETVNVQNQRLENARSIRN